MAADGNAVGFISLGAFADAMGTGVATDYMSERTGVAGTSGWTTHALAPLQSGTTFDGVAAGLEPRYVGEFSPDLSTGVFLAESPLTDDAGTANVSNLYLRTDLRTPGAGTYEQVSGCPLCDAPGGTPLPPPANPDAAQKMPPVLAWMAQDGSDIAFESPFRLTADTPVVLNRVEVYEWARGSVALAGRIPRSGSVCDDVNGPACVGAGSSIAGQGAYTTTRTPHVVSDGSDGHTRLFFTFPTADGVNPTPRSQAGQLYMRVDGTSTIQLNVSERSVPDAFSPAKFLDASADGERVFFMTVQALTDDTPEDGAEHIYMYDATEPPSAPHKLTLINADNEPGDTTFSSGVGVVGLSDDGHYVYFITLGQIVRGAPLLSLTPGLFVWHDGVVRFVASLAGANTDELVSTGPSFFFNIHQPRVTPDGRWLLYRAPSGVSEQLYLYDAGSGAAPVCASCNPSGAPDTASAADAVQTNVGGTTPGWHENHALSDDGSRVFFSTAQALVPEDVNGRADVYEYDVPSRTVHLISSGTSFDDSWFMDASPSGDDVFFTTRQQLIGWDVDQEYDVYDARVGGGFPDPPPSSPPCAGDVCQGALAPPPVAQPVASALFGGAGNATAMLKPRTKPCRRGYVHKRVRGRLRCVKRPKKRVTARRARARVHGASARRGA